MPWSVALHDEFDREFEALSSDVQDELLAVARLLERYGPHLGRSHVDMLAGSRHANMKELRFTAAGGGVAGCVPAREATLLVAGDKAGVAQKRFYAALIWKADTRFDCHLAALARNKE